MMGHLETQADFWLWAISALVSSFAISWTVVWAILHPKSGWKRLDIPNERSLHDKPVARGGGLAMILAAGLTGLGFILANDKTGMFFWPAVAAGLVIIVSYADDIRHMRPTLKFATHAVAALILLSHFFLVEKLQLPWVVITFGPWACVLFSWLLIVWFINLYNFMDGMDGFCAGMTVIGFLALATVAYLEASPNLSIACLVVAGAALGFMYFNFPPARIFMGDVGSVTLGLLSSAFVIWYERHGLLLLWQSLLVFSPFIVDATVTVLRRAVQGKAVWLAHREHYYQKLVALGWSHRRTVLAEYGVMIGCAASALACRWLDTWAQGLILIFWALFYFVVIVWIHYLERNKTANTAAT